MLLSMIRYQSNLPNNLTLIRLLLIPVFVVLIEFDHYFWAAVLFAVAAFTDYLDGYLARKLKQVSDFGKLMDPLADKLLVMSALIMLVGQRDLFNADPFVPAWIVVLILARETWVTGLRSLAANSGKVVAAGSAGKIKSFLQMVAIILLLLHRLPLFEIASYEINASFVGMRLLIASLVFSYWGALEYTFMILGNQSDPQEEVER